MSGTITTFAKATAVVSTVGTVKDLISSFSKPKATIPGSASGVKGAAAGAVSSDNTTRLLSKPGNQKVSEKVAISRRGGGFGYDRLEYPLDPSPYEIQFNFIEYKESSADIEGTRSLLNKSAREISKAEFKDLKASITLPIPNNILNNVGINYEQFDQGPFGGKVTEELVKLVGSTVDRTTRLANEMMAGEGIGGSDIARFAAGAARDVSSVAIAGISAIDRNSITAFIRNSIQDEALRGVIGQTTGTIPNPNRSIQFNSVDLRTFEYSWKFMPHSIEESQTLFKIIEAFQYRSLPESKNKYFLSYPDIVQVKFLRIESKLFEHKLCFVESVNVNYAPSGQPAFFHESDYPVEIELSIRLREVSSLIRDDIKEKQEQ